MIAQQSGNNCVARGLSTMRLALGYRDAVPEKFADDIGGKFSHQILDSAKTWFPNHDVSVFCSPEQAALASDKTRYAGSNFNMTNQEVDNYIIAFSYYTKDETVSHFVVGTPTLYEGMNTTVIVCVKLKRRKVCPNLVNS